MMEKTMLLRKVLVIGQVDFTVPGPYYRQLCADICHKLLSCKTLSYFVFVIRIKWLKGHQI